MKLHPHIASFRVRIALLSVLVSGVVLIFLGGLTFAVLQRAGLKRIDNQILDLAYRHLTGPPERRTWKEISESLDFFLGGEEANDFILLLRDGDEIHTSPNWPASLSLDTLPEARYQDPVPQEAEPEAEPSTQAAQDTLLAPPRQMPQRDQAFPPPFPGGGYPAPGAPPPRPLDGARGPVREGLRPPPGPFGRGLPPGNQAYPPSPTSELPLPDPLLEGQQPAPPPPVRLRTPDFLTWEENGEVWRVGVSGTPRITLVLGFNYRRLHAEMAQVRRALVAVLPLALLLIAAGAWWLSQGALRPIRRLTGTIERVTAKGLGQRIAAQEEYLEFRPLISTFNDMMDRLEQSFRQAVRFSADASHELKTPLTILQGQLEQAVQQAPPGSPEQRRYSSLAKEVQRLKSIVSKLLILSRVDAGELKLALQPLHFSQVLEAVSEDIEILAPQLSVDSQLDPGLWVMADADLLRQVVQNLTSNAIKYNHLGGCIRIRLSGNAQAVRLTVTNSGKEISPEERERVFERFYRGEFKGKSRIRGVGLGLSLSREIIRAHHGDLRLEKTPPGSTAFSIILPRVQPDSANT